MWTFLSMLYSGAVETAAGTIVNGAVSSVTTTCEMQEGLALSLYSLHQEIMKIQCVIDEARRRRITNPKFPEWMASLINAVCLANYYLRFFRSQNSHPNSMIASDQGMSNITAISPSSYRAPKRRRIIKTLKNLLSGDESSKKLNDVLKMLKCIDTVTLMLMVNSYPEQPIKRYLYMDHNRLFSRDKERDQVIRFLFEPAGMAGENNNNVDMLPIVGLWGVGKTSLALHCFHDPKVQEHFSVRIYVKVAYKLSTAIYGAILKQCNTTKGKITHRDKNTLIAMLKQNLSSERFLLVMDDVLLVDFEIWTALLNCLRCGKTGSKVILIFRPYWYNEYKKHIIPKTVQPIILDGFPEEDYMSFFEEHAFGSVDPEDYPQLQKVGREIAMEMNGSIWGAKIFGELLRDNLNAEFWSNFLQCLLKKKFPLKGNPFRCDLDVVVQIISHILPKRLPVKSGLSLCLRSTSEEVKSYRELMVLGPNHCMPVNNYEHDRFEFLLYKHIFLNKCTVITGVLALYLD